jgi:hypothetical protein
VSRPPEGFGPEGSGEPRRPEGSGEPQGGAPDGRAPVDRPAPPAAPEPASAAAPEPAPAAGGEAEHLEVEIDQETYDRLIAAGEADRTARAKAKAAYARKLRAAQRGGGGGGS